MDNFDEKKKKELRAGKLSAVNSQDFEEAARLAAHYSKACEHACKVFKK